VVVEGLAVHGPAHDRRRARQSRQGPIEPRPRSASHRCTGRGLRVAVGSTQVVRDSFSTLTLSTSVPRSIRARRGAARRRGRFVRVARARILRRSRGMHAAREIRTSGCAARCCADSARKRTEHAHLCAARFVIRRSARTDRGANRQSEARAVCSAGVRPTARDALSLRPARLHGALLRGRLRAQSRRSRVRWARRRKRRTLLLRMPHPAPHPHGRRERWRSRGGVPRGRPASSRRTRPCAPKTRR